MEYCKIHYLKLITRKNKTNNTIDKYCPGCKSIPKNIFIKDNLQPAQNSNSNETVALTENEDKHRQNSKNINDK